jgi:hypothetical protein
MGDYFKFHMISPPVYVYGDSNETHTVFGWREVKDNGSGLLEPVVGNPDGSGIGPWSLYYGEDPWHTG